MRACVLSVRGWSASSASLSRAPAPWPAVALRRGPPFRPSYQTHGEQSCAPFCGWLPRAQGRRRGGGVAGRGRRRRWRRGGRARGGGPVAAGALVGGAGGAAGRQAGRARAGARIHAARWVKRAGVCVGNGAGRAGNALGHVSTRMGGLGASASAAICVARWTCALPWVAGLTRETCHHQQIAALSVLPVCSPPEPLKLSGRRSVTCAASRHCRRRRRVVRVAARRSA